MNRLVFALLAAASALVLVAAGCGRPPLDPALVAKHRQALTLSEEPDGAVTVMEVHQTMMGEDPEAAEHEHEHEAEGVAEHDDEAAEGEAKTQAEGDAATEEHGEHEHAENEHGEHEHAEDEHGDHEHADHDHADHDHAGHDHDHSNPVIDEMDVVLVGTVGGVANPSAQSYPEFPFADRQAIFFLADPAAVGEFEEHAHKHAPGEECAFCAAHAADHITSLALVHFKGEDGKPLAVDVRELFGLKDQDTVVVRGKAKMTPTGMLEVDATGLYVRR